MYKRAIVFVLICLTVSGISHAEFNSDIRDIKKYSIEGYDGKAISSFMKSQLSNIDYSYNEKTNLFTVVGYCIRKDDRIESPTKFEIIFHLKGDVLQPYQIKVDDYYVKDRMSYFLESIYNEELEETK